MHGVRQPPAQHLARRPAHDGHEIEVSPAGRNKCDIGAPDWLGRVILKTFSKQGKTGWAGCGWLVFGLNRTNDNNGRQTLRMIFRNQAA